MSFYNIIIIIMFDKAFGEMSQEEKTFVDNQEFLLYNKYYNECYLFGELCHLIDRIK